LGGAKFLFRWKNQWYHGPEMQNRPASISNALLTYFVLFAVVPVGLVVTLNYVGSGGAIQENFVKSRRAVLWGVLDNVRSRLADTEKVSDLVYSNQAVMELLSSNRSQPDYALVSRAMDTFSEFIHYFNSDKYLLSFIIRGENGLDLRYGLYSAFLDFDAVFDSLWFQQGLHSTKPLSWPGMVSGVLTSEPSEAIPLVRPLYDVRLGRRSGTAVLLFQPQLLGNAYAVSEETSGLDDFTVWGPDGMAVYFQPGRAPSPDFPGENQKILRDGKAFLQTRVVSPEGWTLIETVPMDFVERQRGALLASSLVILLGFGLFFLALGVYVSRRVTRPLDRLVARVAAIARGDFEGEIPVGGNDEIARLGTAIRRMQDEIKDLLAEAIRRERNLKRTEIAALQAQINPHFLSNTLNAVRIMADLQNAKGISAIVKALGGMLKSTFSRAGDTVTLAEELGILNDYFYILRVRFKGSIRFVVQMTDESLRSCTILRFLLQPLVENAVFHGIEPRGTGGEVRIEIESQGRFLIIRVRDDGVGIGEDQRARILKTDLPPEEDLHQGVRSGLGIFNIHRRIKIAYGDEYGLHYQSEVGKFTCVTVTLPLDH